MAAELGDTVSSLPKKEDLIACRNESKVNYTATIECANFVMNESTIGFKRLMNSLVYSPSARFAVSVATVKQEVTSIYVLDPFNMQFHQYKNCSGQNLNMEVMYWYSEDCLIFIHIDKKTTNLHQTPVVLNHQKKTYEAKEFVSYIVPTRISFKTSFREAQSIELEGKKYVLLVSISDYLQDVYAISHMPDSSVKLKKYLLDNSINYEGRIKQSLQIARDDTIKTFLSTQIFVIGNAAYFPFRFHCKNNHDEVRRKDVSEMLGIYLRAKFADMPEVPANAPRNDGATEVYINSLYDNFYVSLKECAHRKLKISTETFIRSPGIYRNVNSNLVFVTEEKVADVNVSNISYINCRKRKVSRLHKIHFSKESDVVVCLTPFNILIAKKISPTQISCSTVKYPFKNKCPLTLQEMVLSRTYFSSNVNQKFSTMFRVKRSR